LLSHINPDYAGFSYYHNRAFPLITNITMEKRDEENSYIRKSINVTIKVGTLLLMIVVSVLILKPFISIVLWSIIIAISFYPLFIKLSSKMGNRKKLAASIISLILVAFILIPGIYLAGSLYEGIMDLSDNIENKTINVPPPPSDVAEWPFVGSTIYGIWENAADNLDNAIDNYEPQILAAGKWLVSFLMETGIGMLLFVISVVVAGVFLASSKDASNASKDLFRKLVGERGDEFSEISEKTIRNVVKGVFGVAVIQSILSGIVFMLAKVPYAGLWALLVLVLAIIQIGPALVVIPVIIYLFSVLSPFPATIWTILLVVVMLSDNVLKPILMGKGSSVPMMVIFIGSIGGLMAFGFLGLFFGAILLSLSYKLYTGWLTENS
jgi:predicted PurR-regulated permease PerM